MARDGRIITYRQMNEASNQGAHLFRQKGLKAGDGIALFCENHPRFLEICWAAQRAGLYFTCIPTKLTAGEVAYILRDCEAKIFIASSELRAVAQEVMALVPGVTGLLLDQAAAGFASYEAEIAGQPVTPIADETAGGDMLYSSGTTGRPKGVRQPLQNVPVDAPYALAMVCAGLFGFNAETVYLSPAPLYHAAPLRYCMSAQRLGGTVIVMDHFDPEQALSLIERYRVTASQWVPTMFIRMLKMPEAQRKAYDISSMKVAIHAAAPCPIPVKRAMIEWWGPVLHEYYAGTEANCFCHVNSEEWLKHPGTVGQSLLGAAHICDEEGNELPVGEDGVIYFASNNRFEYHNDPEKSARARHRLHPEWSTLGDVGRLDADGFLYLTDRKAFMIISGGVNIYPQETENLLIAHPKVADVAVIGVPSEEFGEEVKAVVQPIDWDEAGPELAAELIAYCRGQLSPLKCPRTVDFERDLPRQPTGKLYKRLIRDKYWGNDAARMA